LTLTKIKIIKSLLEDSQVISLIKMPMYKQILLIIQIILIIIWLFDSSLNYEAMIVLIAFLLSFDSVIKIDYSKKVFEKQDELAEDIKKIKTQSEILNRYESSLKRFEIQDETLKSILLKYKQLEYSMNLVNQFRGKEDINEKNIILSEILELISNEIVDIKEMKNSFTDALIISLKENKFKVIFSSPMRIPPQLTIIDIPKDAQYEILENSKIGFTIKFIYVKNIESFGFTASAEL
jgi:uncharacterized membrane protein YqjE